MRKNSKINALQILRQTQRQIPALIPVQPNLNLLDRNQDVETVEARTEMVLNQTQN
jgi:hypothetical protein